MMTVSDICDALGRKKMESRLGVSKAAISNAVSDGVFPSAWYEVISDMCREHRIECPTPIFNFRRPTDAAAQASRSPKSAA
ncbi:hypothetical protein [Salipiger abyssi]|uniref:hypothetical protein n=1 Tax=Salipiger abyssi TaxID=1250539 RepID=UPI0009784BA4|nr:hypothetical protein [Salipiger abyssi]